MKLYLVTIVEHRYGEYLFEKSKIFKTIEGAKSFYIKSLGNRKLNSNTTKFYEGEDSMSYGECDNDENEFFIRLSLQKI